MWDYLAHHEMPLFSLPVTRIILIKASLRPVKLLPNLREAIAKKIPKFYEKIPSEMEVAPLHNGFSDLSNYRFSQ